MWTVSLRLFCKVFKSLLGIHTHIHTHAGCVCIMTGGPPLHSFSAQKDTEQQYGEGLRTKERKKRNPDEEDEDTFLKTELVNIWEMWRSAGRKAAVSGREETRNGGAGESRVSPHSSPAPPLAPLWRWVRSASASSSHLPIEWRPFFNTCRPPQTKKECMTLYHGRKTVPQWFRCFRWKSS